VKKESEAKLMKQIGKKLRLFRLKKELSLQQAAASFKIGITTLQKIEDGTTNYNLTLFVKICKLYKVDPAEIMS
jgi:transcriptional regulator with XRE-family HTH domain